jgi:peptidoglycan-N-acetylglucosamine deacetylase
MSFGYLLKRAAATCWPESVMVRGPAGAGRACVTFDDGPHPQQTPVLLDALARADTKATFFLQGAHAREWPQLVREIHLAGHQVANHGFSHSSARSLPLTAYVSEVEQTQAMLEDIVGCELRRDFRPPYGDTTVRAFASLAKRGYRWTFWSHDSHDSDVRDSQQLVERIAGLNLRSGDIILFHDDYAHTVAAMPHILSGLRATGLALVRTDSLHRNTTAEAVPVVSSGCTGSNEPPGHLQGGPNP